MVSYFLCWTLIKFFNSIPENHCQKVVPQLGKSYNIYSGIIFSSLNPVKIFQFNSGKPLSKSSATVGQIMCAMIDASNEVKGSLLPVFWIYNFSWSIVNIRKECLLSGFTGEWIGARNKRQIVQEPPHDSHNLFVMCSDSFPHEPRKKDTHSLIEHSFSKMSIVKFFKLIYSHFRFKWYFQRFKKGSL